jgi:hypothetical protein
VRKRYRGRDRGRSTEQERDRERKREEERGRKTERERERERGRGRKTERKTERERKRKRDRGRERGREIEGEITRLMTILRMDRHTNNLLLKVSHIKRNKNLNLETMFTPSHLTKKAFMSKGGVHMQFCIQIDVRFRVQFPAQGGKHIHLYLIFLKMQ